MISSPGAGAVPHEPLPLPADPADRRFVTVNDQGRADAESADPDPDGYWEFVPARTAGRFQIRPVSTTALAQTQCLSAFSSDPASPVGLLPCQPDFRGQEWRVTKVGAALRIEGLVYAGDGRLTSPYDEVDFVFVTPVEPNR